MNRVNADFNIDFLTESVINPEIVGKKLEMALTDALNQALNDLAIEPWDMHPGMITDFEVLDDETDDTASWTWGTPAETGNML